MATAVALEQALGVEAVATAVAKEQALGVEAVARAVAQEQALGVDAVAAAIAQEQALGVEAVAAAVAKEQALGVEAVAAAVAKEQARAVDDVAAAVALGSVTEAKRAAAASAALSAAVAAAVEVERANAHDVFELKSAELAAVLAAKREVESAWRADQVRAELQQKELVEAQAARFDAENSTRADLNEALMQLNNQIETSAAASARASSAALESATLRSNFERLSQEHARLIGQVEKLLPVAAEVERARTSVVQLQQQLEGALGNATIDGSGAKAINEGVRAQTRQIRDLANAIEPFAWGLDRATAFFTDKNVDGAAEHVRALQLLRMTLQRMRTELDRVDSV